MTAAIETNARAGRTSGIGATPMLAFDDEKLTVTETVGGDVVRKHGIDKPEHYMLLKIVQGSPAISVTDLTRRFYEEYHSGKYEWPEGIKKLCMAFNYKSAQQQIGKYLCRAFKQINEGLARTGSGFQVHATKVSGYRLLHNGMEQIDITRSADELGLRGAAHTFYTRMQQTHPAPLLSSEFPILAGTRAASELTDINRALKAAGLNYRASVKDVRTDTPSVRFVVAAAPSAQAPEEIEEKGPVPYLKILAKCGLLGYYRELKTPWTNAMRELPDLPPHPDPQIRGRRLSAKEARKCGYPDPLSDDYGKPKTASGGEAPDVFRYAGLGVTRENPARLGSRGDIAVISRDYSPE